MGRPEAEPSIVPAQSTGKDAAAESLLSATQAQMETLRRLLLETTESAAAAMLTETREEGRRRIDEAAERAQGIAGAVDSIEAAEASLQECARNFAEAGRALRDQLATFETTLSEGERWLGPRLAEARPIAIVPAAVDPTPTEEAPAQTTMTVEAEAELEIMSGSEFEDAPVEELENVDEDEDEDDDEPPTADQLAQFIRDHEEVEREVRLERRSSKDRAKREAGDDDAERGRSSSFRALEGIRKEFLFAQIGGAVMGLAGGAALVRFVIL
jgi:hypothetical protein